VAGNAAGSAFQSDFSRHPHPYSASKLLFLKVLQTAKISKFVLPLNLAAESSPERTYEDLAGGGLACDAAIGAQSVFCWSIMSSIIVRQSREIICKLRALLLFCFQEAMKLEPNSGIHRSAGTAVRLLPCRTQSVQDKGVFHAQAGWIIDGLVCIMNVWVLRYTPGLVPNHSITVATSRSRAVSVAVDQRRSVWSLQWVTPSVVADTLNASKSVRAAPGNVPAFAVCGR